jgi:hypothetical protein
MNRRSISELRFKWLGTKQTKRLNLFRINWERGSSPGIGQACGYSNKLTVSLAPYLFKRYDFGNYDFAILIAGVLVMYSRSYGGRFV